MQHDDDLEPPADYGDPPIDPETEERHRRIREAGERARRERDAPAGFVSQLIPEAFTTRPPEPPHLLRQRGRDGIWRPWLPRGRVGVLAAGGGVGKTWLFLQLAIAVLTGRKWLGMQSVKVDAAALVLAEEDVPEANRRLYEIGESMGLSRAEHDLVRGGLWLEPRVGYSCALLETDRKGNLSESRFAGELYKRLEATGRQLGLVGFDPFVHFAPRDAEVDNSTGATSINACARFCALPGAPTVLLAHHVTKEALKRNEEMRLEHIRGAGSIVTTARWAAGLARIEDDDAHRYVLRCVKSNGAPEGHAIDLTRTQGGALVEVDDVHVPDRGSVYQ